MSTARSPDGKKLGATQRRVLGLLSGAMLTVEGIASHLCISTASAKCAVDRLFDRGLVVRTAASRDYLYTVDLAVVSVKKLPH